MSITRELKEFVRTTFKTTLRVFLDALKLSPNAQGYVRGSVTELLLKEKIEQQGYEVERIKEKWEGQKHPKHHGDFYVRRGNSKWIVVESKGVKSNSEKWHKLYNYDQLVKFLFDHKEKIHWIDQNRDSEQQIRNWISENLPRYIDTYKNDLYEYEEVVRYQSPKKPTKKSQNIDRLCCYSREQISELISERLTYLSTKLGVLETHFVAGSTSGNRTQATPRKDEFNIVSVDIFLRYPEHLFLFANPNNLDSSGSDPDHLQQNYLIGFVFQKPDGSYVVDYSEEFTESFDEAFSSVRPQDAVEDTARQVDNRSEI